MRDNRAPLLTLQIIDALFATPTISVMRFANRAGRTPNAVQQNVERLIKEGILKEVTGRERNRIYIAPQSVAIVEALISEAPEEGRQ